MLVSPPKISLNKPCTCINSIFTLYMLQLQSTAKSWSTDKSCTVLQQQCLFLLCHVNMSIYWGHINVSYMYILNRQLDPSKAWLQLLNHVRLSVSSVLENSTTIMSVWSRPTTVAYCSTKQTRSTDPTIQALHRLRSCQTCRGSRTEQSIAVVRIVLKVGLAHLVSWILLKKSGCIMTSERPSSLSYASVWASKH